MNKDGYTTESSNWKYAFYFILRFVIKIITKRGGGRNGRMNKVSRFEDKRKKKRGR